MSPLAKTIYNTVFNFLLEHQWIDRVKKSFGKSEAERYAELNIGSGGLDILDAVHCVMDEGRTKTFLETIDALVKPSYIVIEAGVGTGILSLLAAALGAKVYGVELNPGVFSLAEEIRDNALQNKIIPPDSIILTKDDATIWIPPEKANIIISENIYTGMFYEKQVQIMNHLRKFFKNGGIAIPSEMKSFIILTKTEFPHTLKHGEPFAPSKEENRIYPSIELSNPVLYDHIVFTQETSIHFEKEFLIPVEKTGQINGLTIYSPVRMPNNTEIGRFNTTFFNNDLIIALGEPMDVQKGDRVKVKMIYERGGKPEESTFSVNLV